MEVTTPNIESVSTQQRSIVYHRLLKRFVCYNIGANVLKIAILLYFSSLLVQTVKAFAISKFIKTH